MARFLVVHNRKLSWKWRGDVLACAIAESLSEIGHEVQSSTTTLGARHKEGHLVLIGAQAAACVKGHWPGQVHLYNVSEAHLLKRHWLASFIKHAKAGGWKTRRWDSVWDYSPNNAEAIRGFGFGESVYMPVGYHPSFEIPGLDERHDLGFLGQVHRNSPRSVAMYTCAQLGLPVTLCSDGALRSRVFLHIHSRPHGRNFAGCRIIQLGLSNRRAMVAEESDWIPPGLAASGVHFRTFAPGDYDGMIRESRFLLENEEERLAMAARGYEFVSQNWRMVDHVRAGLKELGI